VLLLTLGYFQDERLSRSPVTFPNVLSIRGISRRCQNANNSDGDEKLYQRKS
jgi:hypothetical protein